MWSDFRGVKTIGRLLPRKKLDNPSFLQLRQQESPPCSHINAPYFSTVSITHSRHPGQNIMAQTMGTYTVTFGNGNENSGNMTNCFNTIYNSDEDAKIMRWLSPLEPENRHNSVRTKRHEGVGGWLLKTSEFQEWSGGEGGANKGILFCKGNPGVGKTHLR